MGLRIAVVGSVVDDRIERPNAAAVRSLGGICYALDALVRLAPTGATIVPFCRIPRILHERLQRRWPSSVDWSHAGPETMPVTRVRLLYSDETGERTEFLENPAAPLTASELGPTRACDAVLVNCITGTDLELDAMRYLRRGRAAVHLDVHSLVLGIAPDGRRIARVPDDIREWLACADTIQCNESEARALCASGLSSPAGHGEALDHGVAIAHAVGVPCVVTCGARGAVWATADGHNGRIDGVPVELVDPTGAGDTFGAALVVAMAGGETLQSAVRSGVAAASEAVTRSGLCD